MVQQNGALAALLECAENPFGTYNTPDRIRDIEARTGVWSAHPRMTVISEIAAWHGLNPWGLLAGIIARTAGAIPPHVMLVDRHGNAGATVHTGTSLDLPVMEVGKTGHGKSLLTGTLDELVPAHGVVVPGGTGQGLVKAFAEAYTATQDADGKRIPPVDMRRWKARSVSQETDEFDFMRKEFERAGSQTLSLLRSLTMGKLAGMQNGDKTRNAQLPPHTYRFSAVYVTQADTLDSLMALYKYGDPQRFLFAPVKTYRPEPRPAVMPTWTPVMHPMLGLRTMSPYGHAMVTGSDWDSYPDEEPLADRPYTHAPVWLHWSPQMHVDVPALRQELALMDVMPYRKAGTMTDEERALETAASVRSHFVLTRIKVSAILTAVLGITSPADTPDHLYMDDLAWQIAGAAMDVSMGELAGCFETAKDAALLEERALGGGQGRRNKIARDVQVETQLDGMEQALVPALSALIRLRADYPDNAYTVRDICRVAGRTTATDARDALESLLTSTEFGGVIAVERIGKRYRATDEIMRAKTATEYLDSVRPGWDRSPFVERVDPAVAFTAVVGGVA